MKIPGKFKRLALIIALFSFLISAVSCSPFLNRFNEKPDGADSFFAGKSKNDTVRIVSGSENKVLEPIIEDFTKKSGIGVSITYMGSLDIMRLLEADTIPYDAVWPASGLWISVGDQKHRIKHQASTSTTPVIFGIKKSVAEDLGFTNGKDVYVKDILKAIQDGKLRFTMTSATQSNSGASAYIGFLYALLGSPEHISVEDLHKTDLQNQVRSLLAGVERSSGSSNWLKDLYLAGDYDAMVNYEALIIDANVRLEEEGREPMYAVYPVDGMMIADSPLGFVSDNGEKNRDEKTAEENFQKLQDYLLTPEAQKRIEASGRRTGLNEVNPKFDKVFRQDWGIRKDALISTINMPRQDVLFEALNLYQREFKKPGFNIFVLDFSGSMQGSGYDELIEALGELMIDEKAKANFLQTSDKEINFFIPFATDVQPFLQAKGNAELEALYEKIKAYTPNGGTALYEALDEALAIMEEADLSAYSPSIVLMTDGQPNGDMNFKDFNRRYLDLNKDIPVFTILFGQAKEDEMGRIAQVSRAKVFDGKENLTQAFRSVRGYN